MTFELITLRPEAEGPLLIHHLQEVVVGIFEVLLCTRGHAVPQLKVFPPYPEKIGFRPAPEQLVAQLQHRLRVEGVGSIGEVSFPLEPFAGKTLGEPLMGGIHKPHLFIA
jgi:hypothetical protein